MKKLFFATLFVFSCHLIKAQEIKLTRVLDTLKKTPYKQGMVFYDSLSKSLFKYNGLNCTKIPGLQPKVNTTPAEVKLIFVTTIPTGQPAGWYQRYLFWDGRSYISPRTFPGYPAGVYYDAQQGYLWWDGTRTVAFYSATSGWVYF